MPTGLQQGTTPCVLWGRFSWPLARRYGHSQAESESGTALGRETVPQRGDFRACLRTRCRPHQGSILRPQRSTKPARPGSTPWGASGEKHGNAKCPRQADGGPDRAERSRSSLEHAGRSRQPDARPGPPQDGGPVAGRPHAELPRDAAATRRVAAGHHLPGRQARDGPRRGGPPQHPLPHVQGPDGPGPGRRRARLAIGTTIQVWEFRDVPDVAAAWSPPARTTPATCRAPATSPATS